MAKIENFNIKGIVLNVAKESDRNDIVAEDVIFVEDELFDNGTLDQIAYSALYSSGRINVVDADTPVSALFRVAVWEDSTMGESSRLMAEYIGVYDEVMRRLEEYKKRGFYDGDEYRGYYHELEPGVRYMVYITDVRVRNGLLDFGKMFRSDRFEFGYKR